MASAAAVGATYCGKAAHQTPSMQPRRRGGLAQHSRRISPSCEIIRAERQDLQEPLSSRSGMADANFSERELGFGINGGAGLGGSRRGSERSSISAMTERDGNEEEGSVREHFSGKEMELHVAVALLGFGFTALAMMNAEPAAALQSLHTKSAVDMDMTALALGPEGPLVEEFWDNVSRYIVYFFTVATGGVYAITKPILDLFRSPISAVLVSFGLGLGLYFMYFTVNAMLGLNAAVESAYPY